MNRQDRLIAVDIGNTNITIGVFKGERLIKKMKIPTNSYSLYDKNFRKFPSSDIIISSVVPPALSRLTASLNKIGNCRVSIVGRDVLVPVKNLYRIKSEVGQDRLVNAYAAASIYGAPCAIIDFGTAITFDLVSKKGEYLGGLILPGIDMSLAGLYRDTALLPKVKLKRAHDIIGKDTVNSMRGGILFGFGKMCDGLIFEYRKILGKGLKVIATGGNASLMKIYAKSIHAVDADLTLKGLYLIHRKI
ncbi:MAG: type III pantothenate kinase [Candidatus Omnitrophota bacterium]